MAQNEYSRDENALAVKPLELSLPLPKSLETRICLQLTINSASIVLYLTTTGSDATSDCKLGSFVCALPDRVNPNQTISAPLYSYENSVDFTSRIAKLLARKSQKQVYVGNSISLSNTGMGGSVEEEIECLKKVIEVVMIEVEKSTLNQ